MNKLYKIFTDIMDFSDYDMLEENELGGGYKTYRDIYLQALYDNKCTKQEIDEAFDNWDLYMKKLEDEEKTKKILKYLNDENTDWLRDCVISREKFDELCVKFDLIPTDDLEEELNNNNIYIDDTYYDMDYIVDMVESYKCGKMREKDLIEELKSYLF